MERTGLRSPNKAFAWIKDGMIEIQTRVPEQTKRYAMSVEADTRFYSFPTDMVRLLNVYRKFDSSGKYLAMARIENINMMQDADSSTATSDSQLIVL